MSSHPRKQPQPTSSDLPSIALPPPSEDLLFQRAAPCLNPKRFCSVCTRRSGTHIVVDLSAERKRLLMTESPTDIMFTVCGHAFHEACLFSFLSERNRLSLVACRKCKEVEAYVRSQKWGVRELEAAIERAGDGEN